MKNKIYALAALAAVAVPAWAEDVYSSNIVGYQKIELAAGYNLVGVQFTKIGGQDLDLSDAIKLDESYAGYDDNYDFSSTLRVWSTDAQTYITYGWAGTSGTDVDDDETLDNTWTDLDAYAVDDTLTKAQGIWIRAEKAGTALISGEVATNALVVSLEPGFNLVANPYPKAVRVTRFGTLDSGFAGYDDEYNFKTTLRKWSTTAQTYITYGWAGTSGTDVDDDETLDNTWTDLDAYETDDEILPGEGVWIRAEKAGTITFEFN